MGQSFRLTGIPEQGVHISLGDLKFLWRGFLGARGQFK